MCTWQLAAAGYVSKSSKLIIDLGREQSVLLYFPVNNKSCLVRYAIHVLALPMLKAKHKYSPPPSPCMQHPSTKPRTLFCHFHALSSLNNANRCRNSLSQELTSVSKLSFAKPFHVKRGRVSTRGDSCHVIGTV